jgi:hypothetical protein
MALTLVAGGYHDAEWVRLTFDRAIDIAGIDVGQIVVLDQYYNVARFVGSGTATMVDANIVEVPLTLDAPIENGPDILLDAGAGTGIVAVNDGGTWPGVNGFVLSWV